jgi:hypothetical protein
LPLFDYSASADLSREKLHIVNVSYFPPCRELKNNPAAGSNLFFCCTKKTEEKLPVVFEEIRQEYDQPSAPILSFKRSGKKEQKCGTSPLDNSYMK